MHCFELEGSIEMSRDMFVAYYGSIVALVLNFQLFKRVGKVRNVTIARKKDKDHPGL